MTNPPSFKIGQEVEIVGESGDGSIEYMDRFTISQYNFDQDGERCSAIGYPWYPASSLRLVEPDLKIGDEVEIIGQNVHNNSLRLGQRFVIEQIIIDKKYGTMYSAPGQLGFPAKSLRKLTPEEALCHLTKRPEFTVEQRLVSLKESLEEIDQYQTILRDNGAKRFCEIGEQLAAIENRQKEFDAELSEISQEICTIQHRQSCQAIDIKGLQLRLEPLESYQRGEMPELMPEVMPDCKPNDEPICINICKGLNKSITRTFTCLMEARYWTESVLDGMRSGKP